MFTIYIDDSGSSPDQQLAVASGIIFPVRQLVPLDSEWKTFLAKEGIQGFHSSECLARNPKSAFACWDDARVQRVFARVRQITFKYSVKAFCIAIHKPDYSEVMPEDMRKRIGSFYTWALSSVLGLAYDWAAERVVPLEYVLDNADKEVKREVDDAMTYSDRLFPGHYVGHYSFGSRKEVPALQAVDLFAWTCFQQGRHVRFKRPIHPIAQESWQAYRDAGRGHWCEVQSLNRQGIQNWVKTMYLSPRDLEIREFKERQRKARMPKKRSDV